MVAVIFEVWPAPGRAVEYFDLAGALKGDLEKVDGFVSIERFESVVTKGKFLSLSFWRDEEAVCALRNLARRREAQARGRGGVFAHYRLRVASVVRDYGKRERDAAPVEAAPRTADVSVGRRHPPACRAAPG